MKFVSRVAVVMMQERKESRGYRRWWARPARGGFILIGARVRKQRQCLPNFEL